MSKRFQASYKIAVGFVILVLLAIFGRRYYYDYMLGRQKFPPLAPGTVNIVGVETNAGYAIVVQNRVAKLVYGSTASFGPGEMSEKTLGSDDSDRHFVPIKDMLKGMQGDLDGLAHFVQTLNDIKDDDLPAKAPIWKTEDIDKALNGDAALRKKLVHDINVELDGTPLPQVNTTALLSGIIVDTPVPLKIHVNGETKAVVARVKRPFTAEFMANVERRISQKFTGNDRETIISEYTGAVQELKSGLLAKQDVPKALKRFTASIPEIGQFPQKVLDSITIVLTESEITKAAYRTVQTNKGAAYTLDIDLDEEGTKRLYQFTRDRVGAQLLVTADGVAIGAPRIREAIFNGQVNVAGLEEESLVQDTVAKINEERATKNK